jgi:hypothetical protein
MDFIDFEDRRGLPLELPALTEDKRREMVDERVVRLLQALPPRDRSMGKGMFICHYLADEWACLEAAAFVVAPVYGLDATDPVVCDRLKRAAHEAIKAECRRMAGPGN